MSGAIHPVEEEIIRYVKNNPGCSKSDIVRFIKGKQMMGRPAVLVHIDKLEREKMINCVLERPNSQIYKVYLNEDNKLASILGELEDFKRTYSNLLKKSTEILDKKDYSRDVKTLGIKELNPSRWSEKDRFRYFELEMERVTKLTETISMSSHDTSSDDLLKKVGENITFLILTPIALFYVVVDIIFYRSIIKWIRQIKDERALSQVYSIAYSKIAEIQLELSKFIESVKVMPLESDKLVVAGRRGELGNSKTAVYIYNASGMKSEIKGVMDSITALNEDIKELNKLN
jgi:DNA-binding transcriptional ArsR family regulator